jgi:pyruvate,water dikinase
VGLGVERLRAAGRLPGAAKPSQRAAAAVVAALRDPSQGAVELPAEEQADSPSHAHPQEKPRQLVGQPAAPGLATGKVRRIRTADDVAAARGGEVLVCDAIQPMMTHVVPLAAAIVERRGGMLIHGAIIARELGIPCVNGIVDAVELLPDGEIVTVDGHLGVVTVGLPEFDLELR